MVKRSEFVEFIESIKVNLPANFEKCQRILSEAETLTQQAEANCKGGHRGLSEQGAADADLP